MDEPIASRIPDAPAPDEDADRCAAPVAPERACVADLGKPLA